MRSDLSGLPDERSSGAFASRTPEGRAGERPPSREGFGALMGLNKPQSFQLAVLRLGGVAGGLRYSYRVAFRASPGHEMPAFKRFQPKMSRSR